MTAGRSLEPLRALLRASATLLADIDPEVPQRLLVRADATGTMQLSELDGGDLAPLTALPEPVAVARYVPGGRRAVLEIDAGGNERGQLYLLALDEARADPVTELDGLRPLTADPRHHHHLAGVSPDGRLIAYVSNRANGVDSDLWVCDPATGEHRCVYADGAYCQPASGFSPDGRLLSVLRPGDRPLDLDLVLVDVETGEARMPLPHPGEAALVGGPAWVDPARFYVATDAGRDVAAIVGHDLATGVTIPLADSPLDADADVYSARDGSALLVVANRDGADAPVLLTGPGAGSAAPRPIGLPEPGVVQSHLIPPPQVAADGSRVYFTLSTPRLAGDVFVWSAADGETRRLTHSAAEIAPERLAEAESGEVTSFDGERIPLFVFRPAPGAQPPPVVVVVHGGPESQARRSFNPVIQGLVTAGYAVVVPNVRGSTGYGKRYAALDDTTRRLDSVRDLAAVHGFLAAAGMDPDRAALWGGSYGGYMVLAGLAFQPELWAAGVDIVGISDLVTFLENTSPYRRAHRELEYGSLAHDREFLAAASPLRHADAIRAPLFVIHGRNDPRVPVSEAEQLVAGLARRGVPCTLRVYEDEGHGLARLANRLDAYPQAVAFLDEALASPRP